MTANPTVAGATSPFGVRYVIVQQYQKTAWVSIPVIAAGDKSLLPILAAQGVTFASKKAIDVLKEQLSRLSDYPVTSIASVSGWNGEAFVLLGGVAIAADPNLSVPIAYATEPRKTEQRGSLRHWREGVATLLAVQPLGVIGLGAAFASTLLDLMPDVPNTTIAIVGTEGIGKTSLLQAIASVYGGTGIAGVGQYLETFAVGADALPRRLATHRHHLYIVDAANLLVTSSDKRAAAKAYHVLGHDLGLAETAGGVLAAAGATYRGWVLMAANENLRVMAGQPPTAGEQIVNLTIPPGWAHGAFPTLPDKYADGGAYAEALVAAATQAHGTAIRAFLAHLTVDLRDDKPKLEKRLGVWQRSFLKLSQVDRNNGKDLRGARVFAAIYAALRLAKSYKVLPPALKPKPLILTCYQLYRDQVVPALSFMDRLKVLAGSDRVVAVSKKVDAVQIERAQNALGTVHEMSDCRQLRIPGEKIREAFEDWDRIKKSPEVNKLLVGDGGTRPGRKSKAILAPGMEEDRMFCFRLPYSEPSIFEQLPGSPAPAADNEGWDMEDAAK